MSPPKQDLAPLPPPLQLPPLPSRNAAASATISPIGAISMLLLAVQFGLQPILYKEFAANVTSTSGLVVACELCKLTVALVVLLANGALAHAWQSWRLTESLRASGLAACTYAVQNVLVQTSYQHLPPIVFNLVNQTKLLWTALFVFVLLGKRFSLQQCIAMLTLLAAAVLLALAKDTGASISSNDNEALFFELGLLPVLAASILSGVGAAITQQSMQVNKRDPALVTIELSVYGSVFLALPTLWTSLVDSTTGSRSTSVRTETLTTTLQSLLDGWDALTLIPVAANALGGLLVGAVTKHVGGVLKSFALICGIALTAVVESYVYGNALPPAVYVAAALVAFSLYLFSAYPYVGSRNTTTARKSTAQEGEIDDKDATETKTKKTQ